MRSKKSWFTISAILVVLAVASTLPTGAVASTYKVLYEFKGRPDGAYPHPALIFDAAGNLYSTTFYGGLDNGGTVFKLAPNADGSWTETVLSNGGQPSTSLVFDGAGNLYGDTTTGGSTICPACGTVFKLTPNPNGTWTESVLHSFNGDDGEVPSSALIFDAAGNLYGTTAGGGILSCEPSEPGCGTVFKLAPNSNGSWTESVIHYFYVPADPKGSIAFDAAGNLYGTNIEGGYEGSGFVFKLAPQSGGGWAYSVPRYFYGKPATYPTGVVIDKAGNLYGVTDFCSSGYTCQGLVYEITP